MVQHEIRLTEVEDWQSRAVGMGGQCAWTRWKTTERHLTWADSWHYELLQLKLPSPANLHRWGLVKDPICHLCDKPTCNMPILSQIALAQGRYRWRHDTVLRKLADKLERERRKKRNTKKKACPAINFGQTCKKTKAPTTSIIDESDCWEMKVDLGKQPVFQTSSTPHISQT